MLKIKLSRTGKKNQAHFRVVVSEARSKRDGQPVALIGHYSSQTKPATLKIDRKAYDYWISQGAQPTKTVSVLAQKSFKQPMSLKRQ